MSRANYSDVWTLLFQPTKAFVYDWGMCKLPPYICVYLCLLSHPIIVGHIQLVIS